MNSALNKTIDRLWKQFSSIKLAITLFITIAVLSTIGTVIQQNSDPSIYVKEYGKLGYKIIKLLNFDNLYSSWYFQLLLALLIANLIICSFERLPNLWESVRRISLLTDPRRIKSQSISEEISIPADKNITKILEGAFLKKGYNIILSTEPEKTSMAGEKYRFSRFGAYITHLGVIITIIGAMIGAIWGVRGYVEIMEGHNVNYFYERTTNKKIALPFRVMCEYFKIEYYDPHKMMPKDYYSKLAVFDGEELVMRKVIEVNDPLTYKGYTFYQANYRPAGYTVDVVFDVEYPDGTTKKIPVKYDETFELSPGVQAKVVDFSENYLGFGPVALLETKSNHGKSSRFPVFKIQNFTHSTVKGIKSINIDKYNLKVIKYLTGLQVKKDPGIEVVLTGFIILSLGIIISLSFSHRRVWACAIKEEDQWKVYIGGWTYKNKRGFEKHFNNLISMTKSLVHKNI